jgi:glutamate dehydrogenase
MITSYLQQQSEHFSKIISALPKNATKDFSYFVTKFYAKVPVDDLLTLEPSAAIALAKNAFEFMQERKSDAPKIRLFTPDKKQHGYEARHLVLELINDDMPFLVDSLSMELSRRGFTIYTTIHPIINVSRDKNGKISALNESGEKKESLIHFEISPIPDGTEPDQLIHDLEWILQNVRTAVDDWHKIMEKAKLAADSLNLQGKAVGTDSVDEVKDFIEWIVNKNFIFLGYAEYQFFDDNGKEIFSVIPDSRLGVLKLADEVSPRGIEAMPLEQRHLLLAQQLIEITKSNRRSLVHRSVPMDYIGLKKFDKSGNVVGEIRFLGLFTSNVYYQSTESIPLIRRKVARVLERSEFDPASHDGKSLKTILEFLPRDEIFQMTDEDMLETSMGILALEYKPTVRIFARKDVFERFISFMIFVPRERFSTELRRQIQQIIERSYNGISSSFSTQINEAPLARLNVILRTTPNDIPKVSLSAVEEEIAKCAYRWSDLLSDSLAKKYDEKTAEKYAHIYGDAFPQGYINRYDSDAAVADIGKIEQAIASGSLALELFHRKRETDSKNAQIFHLKIYNPNEEIALSDILPLLENAGFRVIEEHPFLIKSQDNPPVWVRDFRLQHVGGSDIEFDKVKPLLEEALLKVWRLEMENDRLNALILKAGLNFRQVVLLRAYAKYLRQTGFVHGLMAICQAFAAYPQIVKNIVELFESRFNPAGNGRQAEIDFDSQLAQVESAVHDKILRRYIELINATLRTNYFQENNGAAKPVLSFKFNSANVPDLPKPVPYAEIFVYSPRVEGIHLRGGKVARGGLRWSDRPDDFRMEVLGLMKAQMVKNSVIVPVGSKGGFVLKQAPTARDKLQEEGIACYKLYLSGLLDITDNIVAGKIVPPAKTVRHDSDDPYLVVAADKGTASFSDIANSVSAAYGFWLGDAFASGGSVGYDHKKMAITARGAFISVKRHFAEMGVDIDSQTFTATGIGDMAGDVFGNGMLLSNNMRLIAAFNHLHIFIDPTPHEKTSFAERKRLFDLPRSNWTDYDAKLISKGGGVYERSAKSINLSSEAQAALSINKSTITPDELIHAILLAPVDLLWNGGIGTYVKATDETDEQVGDRANNAVRVNGSELRCKIIGEGGNLGCTQKGRIEYARNGGRINTDAIDNSAGVDCSDHEVNIKIAFSSEVASKKLTLEKRDALLASMTDEVASLVLKDNILQTQALSIEQARGVKLIDSQIRLIHQLEKLGLLNRAVEFIPSDKQLAELKTAGKGLTRPVLAVLLSYSKMARYNSLLESNLPDDEYFVSDLKNYFPQAMRKEFASAIEKHPLRREIIATLITNDIVNYAGTTFTFNMAVDLNVSMRDVTAAYIIVRDLFNLPEMWKAIDTKMDTTAQMDTIFSIQKFVERSIFWLLRNVRLPISISEVIKDFSPAVKDMIGSLEELTSVFDIITIARGTRKKESEVRVVYAEIGDKLHLDWLRFCAQNINMDTYFDRLAAQAILGDFYDEQRRLAISVIESGKSLYDWQKDRQEALARFDNFIGEIKSGEIINLSKLMVALNHLRVFV